ncbi:hypothetical protein [Nocardia macrotermitis]|uniref:Lipoprotein n=1 Tax=Nocardia macrotermitis TaxID=2585198 RepID=A0A7K0DET6_9NOCA|nr:hypothetical protein [Nocardia macrotermitis]MQY24305.1 hypothetical protein [Nocardia macrotermitis]
MSGRTPCGATISALIGCVLIVSGCTAGLSPVRLDADASAEAAVSVREFVFRTRTELVLATSRRVIARYDGNYSESGFTQDNSLIYALDAAGRITAMEVGRGIMLPGRVDCHCARVFPLRGTTVGWWQQPDGFVQADLRDPHPAARARVALPAPDSIAPGVVLSGPHLLAAGERVLVLDRVESPPGASWGVNHLSLVDTDTGTVRALGRIQGVNTAFDRAVLRPDGQAVAIAGHVRDGIACGTARLLRIDLLSDRIDTLDPPAAAACSSLEDLRWDGADLTVTHASWESASPGRVLTTVWNRSGTRWERRGGGDTLRYGSLTPAASLEIRRTGSEQPRATHTGDLLLSTPGQSQVLAHDVLDVWLPHV